MPLSRKNLSALIFGLVFGVCVLGAWGWFNTNLPRSSWADRPRVSRISISISTNIPGFVSIEEPVSDAVQKTLKTRNILNGRFVSPDGAVFRVYHARWGDKNKSNFAALYHTPDICWRGVGWRHMPVGSRLQSNFSIKGISIPFECRVFQSPDGLSEEIVFWCTLVRDQFLAETPDYEIDSASGEKHDRRRLCTLS